MFKQILLRTACIGLLLLNVFTTKSQEINDSNIIYYQTLADSLNDHFRPDSAVFYFQKLIPFYQQKGDSENYLKVRKSFISSLISLNQFEKAKQHAEVFLKELQTDYTTAHAYLASTYHSLGRIKESLEGDFQGALVLYRQAANILSEKVPTGYFQTAMLYKDMAVAHFQIRQPDSADYFNHRAIEFHQKESKPDSVEIALIYRQLSVSKYLMGQIKPGAEFAKKGLLNLNPQKKSHEEALSGLYAISGIIYKNLNKLDSAYYFHNAALEINLNSFLSTDIRIAESYQNLASLAMNIGDLVLAEELLFKARDIVIKAPNADPLLSVYIYNLLGNVTQEKYNSEQEAIGYFQQAIAILGEASDPQSMYIKAITLNNIGTVFVEKAAYGQRNFNDSLANEDLQTAIEYMLESIDIAENFQGFPPDGTASFHINLASALETMEKPEESEKYYMLALSLLKGMEQEWAHYTGSIYAGLSELALKRGDIEAYEELSKLSVRYYDSYQTEDKTELVRLYVNSAQRDLDILNLDGAQTKIEKAEQTNLTDTEGEFVSNFEQNTIYHTKAKILESRYEITGDRASLKEALKQYRNLSGFVKNTLLKPRNYKDLVNHISLNHRGYFDYLQICYKLYGLTGEESYKEEALLASESSRSILRKRAILDKNLRSFGSMPDSLLKIENSIDARVAYLSAKVNTFNPDSTEQKKTESNLFAARQDKKAFQTMLAKTYPRYFDLKYDDETTSLPSIRQQLDKNEELLVYMIDGQSLYISLVNDSDITIEHIDLPADFEQTLTNFTSGLTNRDTELYHQAAIKLYQYLFAPIRDKLTSDRIIIVPDGRIWNINFDLLIDDSSTTEATTPDYLLKAYSFSYRYTIASKNVIDKKTGKRGFAAFSFGEYTSEAPQVSTFRSTPADLPGSAKEVKMLSELYDGVFYYGDQSNESTFKQTGSQYSILHMALHGEINEQDYDNSKLYFKQTATDSLEDNYLYPYELYNMDLAADLVVLSACNSGSGNITRGEGIMSLGRAFSYAGVKSLLLSKWEVSDAVAPEIIMGFYSNLDQGMTKDEALRAAKISFLESADNLTRDPYYWGSFYILGDTQPIKITGGFDYTRAGIVFFLFILSAMIAFRIRMKKKNTQG